MNLSKSKYCEGITCLKKLWLSTYKPEEKEDIKESVFETGTEVGELAKKLFIQLQFKYDVRRYF